MKQELTGNRPRMSLLPRAALVYETRGLEYGDDKYSKGNYYAPAPEGIQPVDRLLAYLDATQRHITRVTNAIIRAIGTGGDVVAACRTRDEDGGGKFPASNLPDLAHALSSLAIGVACAVEDGLLEPDPGQPWRDASSESGLPQKDDPDAERKRVLAIRHAQDMNTDPKADLVAPSTDSNTKR